MKARIQPVWHRGKVIVVKVKYRERGKGSLHSISQKDFHTGKTVKGSESWAFMYVNLMVLVQYSEHPFD